MNKVIYIGELTLNISLAGSGSASTRVGDWLVTAAMLDGQMGVETLFVGEAGADAAGDHIVKTLEEAKVDVGSIDRFTEGATPVRVEHADPESTARPVIHSAFPTEPVNPVWPRVNPGDILVFGSYMAIEPRCHAQVLDLVKYAKARKATVVYLPFFAKEQVPRITRVMPAVFDNFEQADMIVCRAADLQALFPGESPEAAFKNHLNFYVNRFMFVDYDTLHLRIFDGPNASWTLQCHPTTNSRLQWESGVLAGLSKAMTEGVTDPDALMNAANETAHSNLAATI